ncbi:MAG: trypsin-like serine protease [Deltaproteobacteria bacterium]
MLPGSSTNSFRIFAAAIFLLALSAPDARATEVSARIVNGLNTHAFPATGALLVGSTADNATSWCSGTLIGCNTFLTAAHCVEDNSDPGGYFVFLQHAGTFSVTAIASHPDFSFPQADVAVLTLGETVTGIAPITLNTTNPSLHIGTTGQIAGFGRSGGTASDYGIKRWGAIETANCSPASDNTTLVCWDFTNPVGPASEDSNTCNGDSGGPLFLDLGAGLTVAGITSGGNNGSCLASDASFDANVYNYQAFINTHLGADSTLVCGGIPPVGASDVIVTGFDGNLGAGTNAEKAYIVSLGSGRQLLRISFNSEDNGSLGADLYVKHGSAPTTSDNDCARDGSGPHGGCSFASPASGDWHILVKRTAGNGEYQVTATEFGGDPAVCGNNLAEFGEDCDGTSDATCPGLCLPDCSCPAPVCGNGLIESGEICDGASASACPTGICASNCSCPAPVCGNDVLESGEECDGTDATACPGECLSSGSACTCPSTCGDGVCDPGETASSCGADCGCLAASACGDQAPGGCYCDETCDTNEDCCDDVCDSCDFACSPGEGGICEGSGTAQKVRLSIARLGNALGQQSIFFTGEIVFPDGSPASFDPIGDGVQVIIEDESTGRRLIDLSTATSIVPAGEFGTGCHPKDGWKAKRTGTTFTYRNRSAAYDPPTCTSSAPGRLILKLIDKRGRNGTIKFVVKAKYVEAEDLRGPYRATIALGGTNAAMSDGCGDYVFQASDCSLNTANTTLRCR